MKKRKWGIVVGLFVALFVGGVIGAVVEHERLLDKINESPSAAAVQTAADWFGTSRLNACVPLRGWAAAAAAAAGYSTSPQAATDWPAASTTLAQRNTEATAALGALVPLANPTGAAEIQELITYYDQVGTALQKASSAGEYSISLVTLQSERTKRNVTLLGRAVMLCPPT